MKTGQNSDLIRRSKLLQTNYASIVVLKRSVGAPLADNRLLGEKSLEQFLFSFFFQSLNTALAFASVVNLRKTKMSAKCLNIIKTREEKSKAKSCGLTHVAQRRPTKRLVIVKQISIKWYRTSMNTKEFSSSSTKKLQGHLISDSAL